MPRRCLVIGGEPSHWEWVQTLRTLAPQCAIFNHYGPTETTVGVLTYRVQPSAVHARPVTPLGRPLANTRVYVLDPHLEPVPIGVPGELYVGGDCLARGYVNRPDLDAQRFVPDPFVGGPGTRVYKTGDVVRYLPDGDIEFLGRLDNQVKIRGFRVELGEIETRLKHHPAVREALVLPRQDLPGGTGLAAYVVPRQPHEVAASDLREFLKRFLPDQMIPAVFVPLPALPLTPHGKVDHQALPIPEKTGTELPASPAASRTPMEHALAEMWEEILGVHPVGATDNFFELGGHSLLAVRLLVKLRQRFTVDVSLHDFFAAPTITGLAMAIMRRLVGRAGTEAVTITVEQVRGLPDTEVRRLLSDARNGSTI